ncbi:MAG: glycosyltransferase family 4 protein [Burkholderiaceae bacterium]
MPQALNEIESIDRVGTGQAGDEPARPARADIRCVVFAPEFPYPPSHGGRADCWRRIQAMRALGYTVMLVCHYEDTEADRPPPDAIRTVKQQVQVLIACPLGKSVRDRLRTLAGMWRLPMHAAARTPSGRRRRDICAQVCDFRPDLLWVEGPWSGELALSASRRLDCPLVYRSHNVEHHYRRELSRAAPTLASRLRLSATLPHLQRYQLRLMKSASIVADISSTDQHYWRRQGIERIGWLPPLMSVTEADTDAGPRRAPGEAAGPGTDAPAIDVLFLGNLNTPNNVEGVAWLIEQVVPRVLARRPGTGFTIAGSRPTARVRALCDAQPAVELIADVPRFEDLQARAGVLVNPVRRGSGVNVKAIDMLATDLPLVSTRQGVAGLPPQVASQFLIDDDPSPFARHICAALDSRRIDVIGRRRARELFSAPSLHAFVTACLASADRRRTC